MAGTNGTGNLFVQKINANGDVQWPVNGVNLSLQGPSDDEIDLIEDGFGGAIVCWINEYIPDPGIYMQRIDSNGLQMWGWGGVKVADVGYIDRHWRIASDGNGGAFLAWKWVTSAPSPDTESNIMMQHVDENGVPQWGDHGIVITTSSLNGDFGGPCIVPDDKGGAIVSYYSTYASNPNDYPAVKRVNKHGTVLWTKTLQQAIYLKIVPDGAGGVIANWMMEESDIYTLCAQRISSDGMALWTEGGVELIAGTIEPNSHRIAADGSGGTIIIWSDNRMGDLDVYAQRLDGAGTAKWAAGGISVCSVSGDQTDPCIAVSGEKGAVISWTDASGAESDIYAQRLDSLGTDLWGLNGVAVCSELYDQIDPLISVDESDGAVVVWLDFRLMEEEDYEIYSQRIDAGGTALWETNGQILCEYFNYIDQKNAIASDGAEGAVAACATVSGLYAQRVDSMGILLWGDNGTIVCPREWRTDYVDVISNGSEGAIAVWEDRRNGRWDIYAQQVDAGGAEVWGIDDIAVCTATGGQELPHLTADGAGGAIIVWQDLRSADWDVYAQRIGAGGAIQWTLDGIGICTASGNQEQIQIIADNAGGAICVWTDGRGADQDIYAQRVDANGVALWNAGGIAICSEAGAQLAPQIMPNGSGGAIITWQDGRGIDYDIYAQRINGDGDPLWDTGGLAISCAVDDQEDPYLNTDGAGGVIIAWNDYRDVSGYGDIYAQRIGADAAIRWALDGVRMVEDGTSSYYGPEVVPDGSGGAIITNSTYGIRAQHVDSMGTVLWGIEGADVISTYAPGLRVASDGAGGALIAWHQSDGSFPAQRFRHKATSLINPILYVDMDATGTGDGSSWDNAYTDLKAAIDTANARVNDIDEIWVAEGTYLPTTTFDRESSFQVSSYKVKIYGGFAGTETSIEEREIDAHITEMSGNIGLSDSEEDNCFQVVTVAGTDTAVVLDGFVICDAYGGERGGGLFASSPLTIRNCTFRENLTTERGGGLYLVTSGYAVISDVIFTDNHAGNGGGMYSYVSYGRVNISNIEFFGNTATWAGGGLYQTGNAVVINASFNSNAAGTYGGGLYIDGYKVAIDGLTCINNSCSPYGNGGGMCAGEAPDINGKEIDSLTISNAIFEGNDADYGGGFSIYEIKEMATITDVEIRENSAYRGGGASMRGLERSSWINVRFLANTASYEGGAMYNSSSRNHYMYNCLFCDNTASNNGGAIKNYYSWPYLVNVTMARNEGMNCIYNENYALTRIFNSIIWGNQVPDASSIAFSSNSGSELYYSLVEDCWIEDGGEPTWNSAYGTDGGNNIDEDPLFADLAGGDLRLLPGSPAIDAGDSTIAGLPLTDLLGNPRIIGETIDMGAYEGAVVTIDVTIATDPSGFEILIGGETYNSPYTFPMILGADIEIGTISPQRDKGTDYYFRAWSDGGDMVHVVTMPDTNVTYTATFADVLTGDETEPLPLVNALHQNHPNPFNPYTTISFSLESGRHTSLAVYDVSGRLVRMLIDGVVEAGPHDVTWDGKDNAGRGVASGVYFYRLAAGEFSETKKMVLLR